MELYKEIMINVLQEHDVNVIFPDLTIDACKIIELKSYQALQQIKEVIADDTLEDRECFEKIEKIVCVLNENGISGGSRHDF